MDETERLQRLRSGAGSKQSILEKYGIQESQAAEICKAHGLLSPIYEFARRNGCWFCPNAGVGELRHLYRNHRELAERLIELEHSDDLQPSGNLFSRDGTPSKVFARFEKELAWERAQISMFDIMEAEEDTQA